MKKLVVLGTALLALNAVASEVQVKAGFDLNRKSLPGEKLGEDFKYKKGPVAGLEYIFDNQGEFEWGLGAEYKMSRNSGSLLDVKNDVKAEGKVRYIRVAPTYVLGKFNMITDKKGNDRLYVLGRVGYGFVANGKQLNEVFAKNPIEAETITGEKVLVRSENKTKGGLYTGIGIGTEYGPLSLEALYERQDVRSESKILTKDNNQLVNEAKTRGTIQTFGIRLGYRFGKLVNDRQPKIVEKVVEKIVTRTIEVPAPAPAVKHITTNNVTLPFSCSANERVCVIKGFKVDGREPNAQEAADLKAIANVINQFAEGGTIDFVGHTDSTGSDAYNQKLSVVRAQNVARLLKEYGLVNTVSYGKITGKGESSPADTNATTKGRYNNRRVELYFDNVDFTNVNFVK